MSDRPREDDKVDGQCNGQEHASGTHCIKISLSRFRTWLRKFPSKLRAGYDNGRLTANSVCGPWWVNTELRLAVLHEISAVSKKRRCIAFTTAPFLLSRAEPEEVVNIAYSSTLAKLPNEAATSGCSFPSNLRRRANASRQVVSGLLSFVA